MSSNYPTIDDLRHTSQLYTVGDLVKLDDKDSAYVTEKGDQYCNLKTVIGQTVIENVCYSRIALISLQDISHNRSGVDCNRIRVPQHRPTPLPGEIHRHPHYAIFIDAVKKSVDCYAPKSSCNKHPIKEFLKRYGEGKMMNG